MSYRPLSFQAPVFLSFFLLILTLSCVLGIFFYGQHLGFNSIIPEAIEDHTWSIAVAISDKKHHFSEGYTYSPEVAEALNRGGMTKYAHHLDNLPVDYPENLKNKELLNQAIHEACNLSISTDKKSVSSRTLLPIPCTDLGLVDYYKLAFGIFGYNIAAPYNFYFILLFISIICYYLAFRQSPFLLALPLIYLVALFCFMPVLTTEINGGTLFNFRLIPTLALIPTFHLFLQLGRPLTDRKMDVFCVLVQSLLLCFLISIRSSTGWVVIASLIPLFFYIFKHIREKGVWHFISQEKPLILSVVGLMILWRAIASYKVMALLTRYRFELIKNYSLSMTTAILSILTLVFCVFLGLMLCAKVTKKTINVWRYAILSIISLALPLFSFLFKETHRLYPVRASLFFILKWVSLIIIGFLIYSTFSIACRKFKVKYTHLFSAFISHKYGSIVIFLTLFLVYKICFVSQLHPIYSSLDVMPSHMHYHNAYLGLCYSPKFSSYVKESSMSDTFGFNSGLKLFLEKNKSLNIGERAYVSPITNTYKMKLHDQTIKSLYLDFFLKHPLIVLQAHWIKLKSIATLDRIFLKNNMRFLIWPFLLSFVLVPFTGFLVEFSHIKRVLIAGFLALVFSALPSFYAYPSELNGDHAIISATSLLFLAAMLFALLAKALKNLSHFCLQRVRHVF
jgi:hypothetical protein